MRKNIKYSNSIIVTNQHYEGETITRKMQRVTLQNEAIESVSPTIYTERKDGVAPEHDIRADKWDIAQQAMEYVNNDYESKRTPKTETE